MQSLLRVSCSTLTSNQGHDNESALPPIIEELRRQTKIFQIFFRTRGSLIDTIVAQIFEDNETTTPLPSPPPSWRLDPITPEPMRASTRYNTIFTIVLNNAKIKNKKYYIVYYIGIL